MYFFLFFISGNKKERKASVQFVMFFVPCLNCLDPTGWYLAHLGNNTVDGLWKSAGMYEGGGL